MMQTNDVRSTHPRFARYAWFVVAFTVLVILWGAVVRATGSGAGCGSHWPTCNGEVIPRAENIETLIEFSHRLTSAFAGVLVIGLLAWAYRLKPADRFVRAMAVLSFIFILIEGGIGAALVRLELVADNSSVLRAVMIAIHLVNTLVLLTFMVLTAWGARRRSDMQLRGHGTFGFMLLIGLVAFALMSAAGAITALGDTLFPAESLIEGIRADLDPEAHFLVRLRVWHPVIAVVTSIFWFAFAAYITRRTPDERLASRAQWLMILIGVQIGVGILNVVLLAPVWMQITHLFLADAMWILVVLISAESLAQPAMDPVHVLRDQDTPQQEWSFGGTD